MSNEMPEKMDLKSMDVAEEKREQLKQLFPEVFSEGKIDFEQLQRVLGEWVEPGKERFGLTWPGKAECMKIIQEPSRATLKPDRAESVDFDNTENLFIEGDNLEVLKLLQKAYFGKIKMIYIDPPYNTGKEFIYPDKYAETLETYLSYTGQADAGGRRFSTNSDTEGRFHTNWLNMMFPRIYLARNLLSEDGVIFISINDKELSALKFVCDAIFGEENLIGTIIWKNATDNNPTNVAVEHEYVHVYARTKEAIEKSWKSGLSDVKEKLIEVGNKLINEHSDDLAELQNAYASWFKENKQFLWPLDRYKHIDFDGVYTGSQSVHNPGKEGYRYDVIHPKSGKPCTEPLMGYRFPEDTMRSLLDSDKIIFGDDENKIIELKVYAKDFKDKLPSVIDLDGRLGAYDLRDLFPDMKKAFTNPKPIRLIGAFLPFVLKEGDTILDFFAGSASTAHAVFDVNDGDAVRRKFILVQLPEPLEEKHEARKFGHSTIADISRERIRRAGEKFSESEEGVLDFGDAVESDTGFRAFKLDRSNFKTWDGEAENPEALAEQLDLHIDHVSKESTPEDILYELLLKAGFPLTTKVEQVEMAGKQVFSVAEGAMLICLEKEVTSDLIDAMADADPLQVICLDESFQGNDQLKANAVQTFKARAESQESEIVFKTV
ncbi:MAG: site-specific DNA-methyltransferase [Magnetovibrionaceae bacterium]